MVFKGFRWSPLAAASLVLCQSATAVEEAALAPAAAMPVVTISGAGDKTPLPQSNRLGIPLLEMAQSATVIDADLIRAQEARNLDEVLSNAPGVVSAVNPSRTSSSAVF